MEENNVIDMQQDYVKYCVSRVTLKLAFVGMQKAIEAWNNHTIPGSILLLMNN